jgi:uncharacterized membrane protein
MKKLKPMSDDRSSLAIRAAGFGVIAGMRATSAPVLLGRHFCKQPVKALERSTFGWICSPAAATVLTIMAIGETVVDKLPSTPDRIAVPGLIGRGLSGALAGAVLNKASGGKMPAAPLVGLAAAIGSSFASFYLRKELAKKLPDKIVALMEDAVAYAIGACL